MPAVRTQLHNGFEVGRWQHMHMLSKRKPLEIKKPDGNGQWEVHCIRNDNLGLYNSARMSTNTK